MRPQKEFTFISDKNPRPRTEDRPYLARLIRGYRRNPAQFRVWRESGEIRVTVIGTPSVIASIRNKV